MATKKYIIMAVMVVAFYWANFINFVDGGGSKPHLVDLARQLNLTELVARWKSVGLDHILNHEGNFTVFAPTDDAFRNRAAFCDNVPLKDLMNYHIGKGLHLLKSFEDEELISTRLKRRSVRMNLYDDSVGINGIVTTASGRQIIKPDNLAFNGAIHVLDEVICSVYVGGASFEMNRCPAFNIFIQAINKTGLYNTLNNPKLHLTVFAPDDTAFKKLPSDIFDQLMKNQTALAEVVLHHIVIGRSWFTNGLKKNLKLPTYLGDILEVGYDGKNIFVNNATITLPNAAVSNGVVHTIDQVLLPLKFSNKLGRY